LDGNVAVMAAMRDEAASASASIMEQFRLLQLRPAPPPAPLQPTPATPRALLGTPREVSFGPIGGDGRGPGHGGGAPPPPPPIGGGLAISGSDDASALMRDPLLHDPGRLSSDSLRELAREGQYKIRQQVAGDSQKVLERVLSDPFLVLGLSKDLGSTENYRWRKANSLAATARVASETAMDGGQNSLQLLSIAPDDSVGVFGAEIALKKSKFWVDDETTHDTLQTISTAISKQIGRVKYVIAVALLAKYNNPAGVSHSDIEEKAATSYACRILECYLRWHKELTSAVVTWRGKKKKFSDKRRCDLIVLHLEYYEKERDFEGVTGREASILHALAWLVELAENKFKGPNEFRDMMEVCEAEVIQKATEAAEKAAEAAAEKKIAAARKGDEDRINKLIASAQKNSATRAPKSEKEPKEEKPPTKTRGDRPKCTRCGRPGHLAETCWSAEHTDGTALAPNPNAPSRTERRAHFKEADKSADEEKDDSSDV
jgi:hypothetical protein